MPWDRGGLEIVKEWAGCSVFGFVANPKPSPMFVALCENGMGTLSPCGLVFLVPTLPRGNEKGLGAWDHETPKEKP
jgi:hypothetical protein